MPLDLSELTLEEALRSYSSVKGHRTRVKKEIGNLLRLLATNYSSTSEERVNDRLEKLEKHTHRLSDIAEYHVSLKYAKARDHRDEVADFKEVLDKCLKKSSRYSITVTPQLPHLLPPSEPGKKQFRAYFDSAQLGALPCSQKQAYLCNCLDTILRARIDCEATGTTPVYSPIMALFTCVSILDNTFFESYPIHVRRKQFFDVGQSAIEFREELLSLLEEADGVNIGCDDWPVRHLSST